MTGRLHAIELDFSFEDLWNQVGFALAHAVHSMSLGEDPGTMVVACSPAGSQLVRFESETVLKSIENAGRWLSEHASGTQAVLVFDASVDWAAEEEIETLVAEPYNSGEAMAMRIMLPYRSVASPEGFGILSYPHLATERGDQYDLHLVRLDEVAPQLAEGVYAGWMSHPMGPRLWPDFESRD